MLKCVGWCCYRIIPRHRSPELDSANSRLKLNRYNSTETIINSRTGRKMNLERLNPTDSMRRLASRLGEVTLAGLEKIDNGLHVWDDVDWQIPGINIQTTEDHIIRGEE